MNFPILKKTLGLIMIIGFAQIVCSQQSNSVFETYSNSLYSISYPFDWNLMHENIMGTQFIIRSPQDGANDKFIENVNLIHQDVSKYNVDLDEYLKISLDQMKQYMTDVEIKEIKRVTSASDGTPYYLLRYHFKQEPYMLSIVQKIILHRNHAYVLTFTSEVDSFQKFEAMYQKMFESFVLKQ